MDYGGQALKTHKLKIEPKYFKPVEQGYKTFEIRKNDRNFQVNDMLVLQEYDRHQQKYTGRSLSAIIVYITDYMQKPNYVVMSILPTQKH